MKKLIINQEDEFIDLTTLFVLKDLGENNKIYDFLKNSSFWLTGFKHIELINSQNPLTFAKTKQLRKAVDALSVDLISNFKPQFFSNVISFRTSNKQQTELLESQIQVTMKIKNIQNTSSKGIRIFENENYILKTAMNFDDGYNLFAIIIISRQDFDNGLDLQ